MNSLQKAWSDEWEKKAVKYIAIAEEAARNNNFITARELYFFATQCYYSIFLINLPTIDEKKRIYIKYASCYRKSTQYYSSNVEKLYIHLDQDRYLPCYLHHPDKSFGKQTPCVIVYAGLGSCKEEMHMLARPLVERGISVLVPDMPGSGEALFLKDIKCCADDLNTAFKKIPDFLETRDDIRSDMIGTYGLCMGGGYAYRAASIDPRYSLCVTFFALRITQVSPGTTPQWMKQGDWFNYQTGNVKNPGFSNKMKILEEGNIKCPFLFIHGEHDNWMTLESAMHLFENAEGPKEKIIIKDEPVFSTEQFVTHTMPVGEQLHWIKNVAADWVKRYFHD